MIRRILAFLVASAAVAAGLIYAPSFSFNVGTEVALHEVTVKARDLTLVCPGPAFRSGGASGTSLGEPVQTGSAEVQGAWSSESGATLSGAGFGGSEVNYGPGSLNFSISAPQSFKVTEPAATNTQGSSLLNVIQLDSVATDRMKGLLGSTCQRPQSEFWIVGGDTTTGREAILVLENPSSIDATVELELVASNGVLSIPGLTGISVPSRKAVAIPLNGLSAKNATFSVHVKARGGAIAGWIQQKTVRGTVAAGADLISPTAAAAKTLVIPGFFVRGAKDAAKLQSGDGDYADLTNIVRVTNPGNAQATLVIQVIGATSKTFGTVIQAKVPANTTVDLEVPGLADGDYSIFIDSSKPVLAAAKLNRTSTSSKQLTDFAWLVATEPAAGNRTFVAPKVGISKLSIANAGAEAATFTLTSGNSTQQHTIKPGATQTFLIEPGSTVRFAGESPVAASVVVDVDFAVAVLPMIEQRNLGGQVGVLVR